MPDNCNQMKMITFILKTTFHETHTSKRLIQFKILHRSFCKCIVFFPRYCRNCGSNGSFISAQTAGLGPEAQSSKEIIADNQEQVCWNVQFLSRRLSKEPNFQLSPKITKFQKGDQMHASLKSWSWWGLLNSNTSNSDLSLFGSLIQSP